MKVGYNHAGLSSFCVQLHPHQPRGRRLLALSCLKLSLHWSMLTACPFSVPASLYSDYPPYISTRWCAVFAETTCSPQLPVTSAYIHQEMGASWDCGLFHNQFAANQAFFCRWPAGFTYSCVLFKCFYSILLMLSLIYAWETKQQTKVTHLCCSPVNASSPRVYRHPGHQARSSPHSGAKGQTAACLKQ